MPRSEPVPAVTSKEVSWPAARRWAARPPRSADGSRAGARRGRIPRRRGRPRSVSGRERGLAAAAHAALAEQEPVEGDVLLRRERDQEVGVGGRAVLVAVHVL